MEPLPGLYQCLNCKTNIRFSSAGLNVTVCPQCGLVLRKKEGGLAAVAHKKLEASPDPVQPGTTGVYEEKSFEVKGRFRAWFEESLFNYWTIAFEDNSIAYLAEGYGLYDVYLPKPQADLYPSSVTNYIETGNATFLHDNTFILLDKSTCTSWEAEGELWMPATDEHLQFTELGSTKDDSRIVSIHFGKEVWQAFRVNAVSYSSLQLKNLDNSHTREKKFTCATCRQKVVVYAFPYSYSCSCGQCGTRYKLTKKHVYEKEGKDAANKNECDIQIGAKGFIKEIEYTIIGYALKQEMNAYAAKWKEYTLYNEAEGFAFLSEYQGHWIYAREQGKHPVFKESLVSEFDYRGEAFRLYNSYSYKTIDTLGEFPYDVSAVADVRVREYISPPKMWIGEWGENSVNWFLGEHIEGGLLQKEFGAKLSSKQGIGAVQPMGYVRPYYIILATIVAGLLFIAIHLGLGMTKENRTLLDNTYYFSDTLKTMSQVSQSFTLDKWKSDIEFNIASMVDNTWLSFDATLVNIKNGTEYSFAQPVEYYHGVEDGESWSEGSRNVKAYVSSVPAGTYLIRMNAERDETSFATQSFSVTALYDTSLDSNLFIILGFLIIVPVVWVIYIYRADVRRWQNSDYSPYDAN